MLQGGALEDQSILLEHFNILLLRESLCRKEWKMEKWQRPPAITAFWL